MKIRKTALIISIVFIFSVAVFGYAAYKEKPSQTVVEDVQKNIKTKKEKYKGNLKKFDFKEVMKKQGYYPDEINSNMSRFIELMTLYDMDEKDIKELYKLVEQDCDFRDILEIYSFVQNTKNAGDIKYVKELYNEASKVKTTSKYWVEEAYDRLENNKHGDITNDDIEYYEEKGISLDEISELNTLIRKSDCNIKDMLDKRVKGESWAEISAEITGNRELKNSKIKKEKSLSKINNYIFYSYITGDEIIEVVSDDENISSSAKTKVAAKVQLICDIKEEYQVSDSYNREILDFAAQRLKGVSEKSIKKYLKNGITIREMEEIKKMTDKHNLNFEKYMEEGLM